MPMQAQAGTARIATFLAISNTNHHPTHSGGRDVATRNLGIREATKGVKVMMTHAKQIANDVAKTIPGGWKGIGYEDWAPKMPPPIESIKRLRAQTGTNCWREHHTSAGLHRKRVTMATYATQPVNTDHAGQRILSLPPHQQTRHETTRQTFTDHEPRTTRAP